MRAHRPHRRGASDRRRWLERASFGHYAPEWVLRAGGVPAAMDIDFVNDRAFVKGRGEVSIDDFLITTRSNADINGYTKANGTVELFDVNTARYGTNGLRTDVSRTNLLLWSQEFDDAAWTQLAVTIDDNNGDGGVTAPDGTVTADKIIEDNTTNFHSVSQTVTIADATYYTYSIYVRNGTRRFFVIQLGNNFVGNPFLTMDLDENYVETNDVDAYSVEHLANNWVRVSITALSNGTTGTVRFTLNNETNGGNSYAGDSSSSFHIWGAQLEAGLFPTEYLPTEAAAKTRGFERVRVSDLSFQNPIHGTFFSEFVLPYPVPAGSGQNLFGITDGLDGFFWVDSNQKINYYDNVQGAFQPTNTVTHGAIQRAAAGYYEGGRQLALNGTTGVRSTGNTAPGQFGMIAIGSPSDGNSRQLNGYTRRATYWDVCLSEEELETVTSLDGPYAWALPADATAMVDLDFTSDRAWVAGSREVSLRSILVTLRSTGGYAENTAGELLWFEADEPRLTTKGLLTEQARTNTLAHSQDFTNVAWTPHNISVFENVAAAPDGTITADLLIPNTTDSVRHYIHQGPLGTDAPVVYSVYAKGDGSGYKLWLGDNAVGARVYFTLSGSGTVSTPPANTAGYITPLANGWYRCEVTITAASGIVAANDFWMGCSPGTDELAAGNGINGIYLWGVQIENATAITGISRASSYFPTAGVAATRAVDEVYVVDTSGVTRWFDTKGTYYADGTYMGRTSVASPRIVSSAHEFMGKDHEGRYIAVYRPSLGFDLGSPDTTDLGVKGACAFQLSARSLVGNGGTTATDALSFNWDGFSDSRLWIGVGGPGGGDPTIGYTRRVIYWRGIKLPDATLEDLTTP